MLLEVSDAHVGLVGFIFADGSRISPTEGCIVQLVPSFAFNWNLSYQSRFMDKLYSRMGPHRTTDQTPHGLNGSFRAKTTSKLDLSFYVSA